jgi:hypothetical protein
MVARMAKDHVARQKQAEELCARQRCVQKRTGIARKRA